MDNISVPPMIPLSKLRDMKHSKQSKQSIQSVQLKSNPESHPAESKHPAHQYKLMGVEGIYAEAVFPLEDLIIIGRDAREANIVYPIDAMGVSRKHCCVWVSQEGRVLIKDLGSSNGTFFADGTRLQPNVTYRLNPGECFYLGSKQEAYKLI